jgi:hypothetical protein
LDEEDRPDFDEDELPDFDEEERPDFDEDDLPDFDWEPPERLLLLPDREVFVGIRPSSVGVPLGLLTRRITIESSLQGPSPSRWSGSVRRLWS